MHRTCCAAVGTAAGGIVPHGSCAGREPDLKSIEEHAIGIIWINNHTLIVPVLGIVACAVLAVSQRAALGTLHESPACTAVGRPPSADLAARGTAAAEITVTHNGLYLGIQVIVVTRGDRIVYSAQLIAGGDVNKRRAAPRMHRCPSRIGPAADRIAKHKPIGVAGD